MSPAQSDMRVPLEEDTFGMEDHLDTLEEEDHPNTLEVEVEDHQDTFEEEDHLDTLEVEVEDHQDILGEEDHLDILEEEDLKVTLEVEEVAHWAHQEEEVQDHLDPKELKVPKD